MFSRPLIGVRSIRSMRPYSIKGHPGNSSNSRIRGKASSSSPVATNATPIAASWLSNISTKLALGSSAAAILGTLTYLMTQKKQELQTDLQRSENADASPPKWAADIGADDPSAKKVLTTEALLQQEHPFLEDDHMFSAFVARGIVQDIEGWYIPTAKRFDAVVKLGREVAGFPRVVHGGLTAAIFDEVFGGLLFSLKESGALRIWGPAYTVSLEVGYKARIKAASTILVTAEVESMQGRKIWMKAVASDGPNGKVYATARALFVAPKPLKLIQDVGKYVFERLGEKVTGRQR